MKSYEETIASVFAKGDAILESKRIRARRIKRISCTISGICAAAIVGFYAIHSNIDKNNAGLTGNNDNYITEANENVTNVTSGNSVENTTTNTVSTHTTVHSSKSTVSVTVSSKSTSAVNTFSMNSKDPGFNSSTSQTTISTDASYTVSDDERSLEMKKVTAFATAFLTGLSTMPFTANANDNYKLYSMESGEKEVIAQMANYQTDTDIDGNGQFDINDCYQLYLYTDGYVVDDTIKERAEKIADYDHDGGVYPFSDAMLLMKYYILSNPLDTSIFDINNYENHETTPELAAELAQLAEDGYVDKELTYTSSMYFVSNLKFYMRYYGTGYGFLKDMVDRGEASLDINDDGVFDIRDCIDYEIFIENLLYNDPELYAKYGDTLVKDVINWDQDGLFYIYDDSIQGCEHAFPCEFEVIKLPESTIERCADLFGKLGEFGGKYSGRYMAYCYLQNNPLDQAYFNKDYFEQIYSGAVNYDINAAFIFAARTSENIEYTSTFDKVKFGEDFKQYCQDIENGQKSVPDLNFDGKLDYYDYSASITYLNQTFFPIIGETEEEIENNMPFSKKQYDYFAYECDINGDGKSGDIYDIVLIQCYMLMTDDDIFNASACEELNISTEYHSNFELLDDIDIDRNGDANLDGDMDMSDAVIIMQSQANPDKYELTNKGKFNGDIYETGNGITVNDALQVQKKLLGIE